MGFSIISKKKRNSALSFGGSNYQKLRSVEDLSTLIDKEKRQSLSSNLGYKMSTQSTYNKRFSEQSFNSISDISVADTYLSNDTSYSVESNDINDIYAYYQPNEYNVMENNTQKKPKKHRKRKALSKLFQSFSLDGQLQQSMQCPDWEYYCNKDYYRNSYSNY